MENISYIIIIAILLIWILAAIYTFIDYKPKRSLFLIGLSLILGLIGKIISVI